jgi:hypothetical protein
MGLVSVTLPHYQQQTINYLHNQAWDWAEMCFVMSPTFFGWLMAMKAGAMSKKYSIFKTSQMFDMPLS